jgi:hypothetical protein
MRTNHIGSAGGMAVAVAVATVLTFAAPAAARHEGGKGAPAPAPTPTSFADMDASLNAFFASVDARTDLGAAKNFLVKRAQQAMTNTATAEQLLAKGRKRQARTFLKRAQRDLIGFKHRLETSTSKSRISDDVRKAMIAAVAPVSSQLDGLRSTL